MIVEVTRFYGISGFLKPIVTCFKQITRAHYQGRVFFRSQELRKTTKNLIPKFHIVQQTM